MRHVDAHQLVDPRRQLVACVARELRDVDDTPACAVGHLQGGIAHLASLLAEDGAQQALLGRQLGLALRGDLAHQHVAGFDLSARQDDAVDVEVGQHLVGKVGHLVGDFLRSELRVARIDLVFGDVDGGEEVFAHHALGHDDGVLVVVAFPRHVGHHEVLPECQLGVVGGRPVCQRVAGIDLLALAHERVVVDAHALVGALELLQLVAVHVAVFGLHLDAGGVHEGHDAGVLGNGQLAGVDGDAVLHARTHQRRMRAQQGHSLALHVRAHQGAVGVVVLEEGDERRGHRGHLARRDVHVVDLVDRHLSRVAENALAVFRAAQDTLGLHELAILVGVAEDARLLVEELVGLGDRVIFLFVGRQVDHLVGDLAALDLAIRRLDKSEGVHATVGGQRADQADVGAFRRLDGAHAPVVGGVHVANLEAGAVARQAARAECRQAAFVGDARGRVGLVHEL